MHLLNDVRRYADVQPITLSSRNPEIWVLWAPPPRARDKKSRRNLRGSRQRTPSGQAAKQETSRNNMVQVVGLGISSAICKNLSNLPSFSLSSIQCCLPSHRRVSSLGPRVSFWHSCRRTLGILLSRSEYLSHLCLWVERLKLTASNELLQKLPHDNTSESLNLSHKTVYFVI